MSRYYGGRHQRIRAALLPEAYGTLCALCGQPMLPGQALDLDHTADRAGYRGMAHAHCNRSEGPGEATLRDVAGRAGCSGQRDCWSALSRLRPHEREQLPVGVGFAVGFLPGDIGVSLGTTDLPLRFSEVAPICAPILRSTPLAAAHRNDDEQHHENDRDRDYGNDDAGAHLRASLPGDRVSG